MLLSQPFAPYLEKRIKRNPDVMTVTSSCEHEIRYSALLIKRNKCVTTPHALTSLKIISQAGRYVISV